MRFFQIALVLLLTLLLFSSIASAQICGDANDDAVINIIDLVTTIDYTSGIPTSINLTNADCDGVTGVTLSDAVAFTRHFFRVGTLDCNPVGSYSLSSSTSDTIHIVRVNDVPSNVDNVYLLVYATFSEQTEGAFVPIMDNGTGSSGFFNLTIAPGKTGELSNAVFVEPNIHSIIFSSISTPVNQVGVKTLILLKYERDSIGTGSILPEAFDRETPWEISIARNNDLFRPVIEYHDMTYPNGTLHSSQQDLQFYAVVDSPSLDTITVDILHGAVNVSFKLSTPTPWIHMDQTQGVTPATISFTVDATGYGALDYDGIVRISYEDFYPAVDSIDFVMSVHESSEVIFPPGDINCDGATNVLDLNYLINYLFRFGTAPQPCE